MTEYELKFRVPSGRRGAVAADVAAGGAAQQVRLRARYFDTRDGRLAAHRMALRLRQEGDARWVQTLKAAGDGAFDRFEHEVEVDGPPPGRRARPAVDPALHAGTGGGDRLLALLHGDAAGGGAPADPAHHLVERYATDVQRTLRTLALDGATVEIAFDRGRITAGDRRRAVCEVEFELKDGTPGPLFTLAREWAARHGLWLDTVSKAERGHRLAEGGAATPPAARADDPDLPAHASGGRALRAIAASCLTQVLANASEVAEGSTDDETIHQLRVGLRRLRTALRAFAGLAPGLDATWEAALAGAFRRLGEHRDREHLLRTVAPELAAVGAPPVDGLDDNSPAAPDPGAVVRDAAFQQALLGLVAWAQRPPADDGADAAATRKALAGQLDKLHRGLLKDGKRFEALSTDDRHRARKRLKRLRYLAEFVAPLFDAKAARRYLKRLRPAQDALGAWHDDVLALDTYEAAAARDPRAWYAVGWLTAQQPAHAGACHRALRRLKGATPFWGKA